MAVVEGCPDVVVVVEGILDAAVEGSLLVVAAQGCPDVVAVVEGILDAAVEGSLLVVVVEGILMF